MLLLDSIRIFEELFFTSFQRLYFAVFTIISFHLPISLSRGLIIVSDRFHFSTILPIILKFQASSVILVELFVLHHLKQTCHSFRFDLNHSGLFSEIQIT